MMTELPNLLSVRDVIVGPAGSNTGWWSHMRSPQPIEDRQGSAKVRTGWRNHSKNGGARRDRTDDLMLAKHALSQLSYGPISGTKQREAGGPG